MKIPPAEFKTAAGLAGLPGRLYFLPVGTTRSDGAVREWLALAKWYACGHVILRLLPVFFIPGVIGAFVCQT